MLCACRTDQGTFAAASAGSGGSPTPGPLAASWTQGQKRLILIRVDFSDLPGQPFTNSAGTNMIAGLNSFYTENSYGLTSIALLGAGSDLTATFRMPQPSTYYTSNNLYDQLLADARSAATAAGFVLTNYDFDFTCFGAVSGWSWSGMANVGAAGAWLRNSFSTAGTIAHELGHNFGLNHANFWDTSGQSVIGPGASAEQGDIFDTMGWALAGNNHFNARYKSYLNWLLSNEVASVTASGIYRIYAHDDPNSSGLRALKIARDSNTNYWVEFRQKFTSNNWLMNGAGLHWAQNGSQKALLLDTTPGSGDGKNDSAIVIGRTFTDPQAGIHITPIGKGDTSPQSLDVVVNIGAFPANVPPTVLVIASGTNAAIGSPLTFSASASDANGDALAYYWDFGDGSFGTNGPASGKSWSTAGEYLVRCLVTDMKGGLAAASVVVQIGSPATYRINGLVTAGGSPVVNARVSVSSTKMTYTSSDGTYSLVGLGAGSYTVNASLYGCSFSPSGFSNSVTIGPNASGINFTSPSPALNPPNIIQQPASQGVACGQQASFTVSATGTSPLSCQWRFNGTNVPSATNGVLVFNNVQVTNAGNYAVVITNAAGATTSVVATLTISVRPTLGSVTLLANGQPQFTVSGAAGDRYAIQSSSNLTDWIEGATITNMSSTIQFTDTSVTNAVRRFYRCRLLP